jgi:hypothetical protein
LIGFAEGKLQVLEVEEVEMLFCFPQSKQVVFSFGLTLDKDIK